MATDLIDHAMVTSLREQFGDSASFAELVDLFSATGQERLDKLEAAVRAHQHETIKEIAHSIKGSAAALGASDLADRAQRLESDPASANGGLGAMRDALAASVDALRGVEGAQS